ARTLATTECGTCGKSRVRRWFGISAATRTFTPGSTFARTRRKTRSLDRCPSLAGAGDSNRLGNGERSSVKPKARKGRASGRERVSVAEGRVRDVGQKQTPRDRKST